MNQCKNCRTNIKDNFLMECPNCGASFCHKCGKKNQNICPYCYSDLNYKQF